MSGHDFDSMSLTICNVEHSFSFYILGHLNGFTGIDIQLLFRHSLYSLLLTLHHMYGHILFSHAVGSVFIFVNVIHVV